MSNKYYWEGIDIAEITGTTSTNSTINGYLSGFPGNTTDATEISTQADDGMTTNESDFNSLPSPNTSYFCYNDDEDADAPGYRANGKSIFTNNISNQRLLVTNESLSSSAGTGTLNIPSWCNGVKIVFRCTKGADGSAGTGVSADNYNVNTDTNEHYDLHNNHNVNNNRGIFRNNRNYRQNFDVHRNNNHDQAINITAQNGGEKGIGGTGRIGWFLKGIQFTAGSNNTIDYSITTTHNSNSTITVKESGSNIAIVTIKNGGNGTDGTDASSGTIDNVHNNVNHEHYNTDPGVNDNIHKNHQDHQNHQNGSAAGNPGDNGDSGAVSFNGSTPMYLHYNNNSTTETTRATIYYFRYKTS
jgi:hypothetical protein